MERPKGESMTARIDQLGKVTAAAEWLAARNAEVMLDGFTLHTVTVRIQPEGDTDPTHAASVTFNWSDDDHYDFTVS